MTYSGGFVRVRRNALGLELRIRGRSAGTHPQTPVRAEVPASANRVMAVGGQVGETDLARPRLPALALMSL